MPEGTWEPNSLTWVDPQVSSLGETCQLATLHSLMLPYPWGHRSLTL